MDWSPAEDLRPGRRVVRNNPEVTTRGKVWTHRVDFDYPWPGYTYATIRDCGDYVYESCHLYRLTPEEDGA